VATGVGAGYFGQGSGAVAIGLNAGQTQQGTNAVAIGVNAGTNAQGSGSIAVGYQSGWNGQARNALAIGTQAGYLSQRTNAVAIGTYAGMNTQGSGAIAIGNQAGYHSQGAEAVAIGNFAGYQDQPANSIVINASGSIWNTGFQNACYIRPIRVSTAALNNANVLFYNPGTYELIYGAASTAAATVSTKTFVIDHPTNTNKYLVHACLEGPESGVYYRGEGQIVNNLHTTIRLPAYVEHLATGFTIQITPIYSGEMIKPLYTSRVKDNSFTVYGENCEFFWHVTGKRGDIEVEPSKATTTVKGSGPYRWI
jgi:hypothetical protein